MQAVSAPSDLAALHRRALGDLAERARAGMYVHLMLWLVLGWTTGIARALPLFFGCVAAAFAAPMALRIVFQGRLASHAHDRPARRWAFLALILTGPTSWGLLVVCSHRWPALEAARIPILLVTVGVVAAGGMGLAINPVVRRLYPSLAMGPPVVQMMLAPETISPFLACAAALFVLYVFRASHVVHSDYWAAAYARLEIEVRARQLEQMSMTDGLTGVHNRQFLDRRLAIEWRRAEPRDPLVSLLMIDVDHFKRINDTHGHPFGDQCLQAIARALQAALNGPEALVARYGGEEFAVLLPGLGDDAAMRVAERLHRAVGELAPRCDGRAVPLACSVGVHSADVRECSAAALLAMADKALYAAKQRGRNRIVSSASLPAAGGAVPASMATAG